MVMNSNVPRSFRPAGTLPAFPLAYYTGPWNVRLAAHLLRRAGFGGSPSDVQRLARLPMRSAVASLVNFPATSGLPDAPNLPDELSADGPMMAQRTAGAGAMRDPQQVVELRKQRRKLEVQTILATQLWWLNRMIATPAPLQEKMTLFWHGHFTTAAIQKGVTPAEVVAQNALFRQYALGNVRELTQQISLDPGMLKYLDNIHNAKAHPNENYARELMELFTLGIGNYGEHDVRESARAWTGLRVRRGTDQVFLNPRLYDDGSKTFLGKSGTFNGRDVVNIIFTQPAASKFIATKLLEAFVYDDPEPELVDGVAALLRRNDFNLRPVMETLLVSNVFYSPRAYRALVKSPVEFVVGSYQLFGVQQADPKALAALRRMNQVLFYPPNVKGWPGGSTWLNSTTVLARENFTNALMTSGAVMSAADWLLAGGPANVGAAARTLVDTIVQGDVSEAALAKLQGYLRGDGTAALGALSGENFDQRMRGGAYLTMAMPPYQLA
jgi:uncharacterized protein (DUF1800 family)